MTATAGNGLPCWPAATLAILFSFAATGLFSACGDDDASAELIVGLECHGYAFNDVPGTVWAYDDEESVCDPGACLTKALSVGGETQTYEFCTCRCADGDGNTASDNALLCTCPSGATCVEVLGSGADAPADIAGSYCVPGCVDDPGACAPEEECAPPEDAANPWDWSCQ